ncbi:hypothetical protein [Methylorubrum extorquens]|jgi:hypothetical protein|uniref:Uncharacterized protein n=2 Tax=Methylorubrum extorquens TaxID=408 RepID=C5B4K7_METEA|nr:hypothetical protein [Methylorubrum extorquens]ACS43389.1 Hypothetical protein MexAM1_META2p0542 [Methylorubrum extorquens AM1]EHP90489.1 hypothetical protein MetexDRAFT_4618 [Methylorubrum extorquens DSM 13060]MCP1545518.1 hypothetical protein [Methylorubrum extorquens]MCP1591469.1 hypothetical protein [Methylorubrum extorquens]
MRRVRIVAGSILGVLALVATGTAFMVARSAVEAGALADEQRVQTERACRTAAQGLGQVKVEGSVLEVRVNAVADPRQALADASALLIQCPTRVLAPERGFCLGQGCANADRNAPVPEKGPVVMTMRLIPRK